MQNIGILCATCKNRVRVAKFTNTAPPSYDISKLAAAHFLRNTCNIGCLMLRFLLSGGNYNISVNLVFYPATSHLGGVIVVCHYGREHSMCRLRELSGRIQCRGARNNRAVPLLSLPPPAPSSVSCAQADRPALR